MKDEARTTMITSKETKRLWKVFCATYDLKSNEHMERALLEYMKKEKEKRSL